MNWLVKMPEEKIIDPAKVDAAINAMADAARDVGASLLELSKACECMHAAVDAIMKAALAKTAAEMIENSPGFSDTVPVASEKAASESGE